MKTLYIRNWSFVIACAVLGLILWDNTFILSHVLRIIGTMAIGSVISSTIMSSKWLNQTVNSNGKGGYAFGPMYPGPYKVEAVIPVANAVVIQLPGCELQVLESVSSDKEEYVTFVRCCKYRTSAYCILDRQLQVGRYYVSHENKITEVSKAQLKEWV